MIKKTGCILVFLMMALPIFAQEEKITNVKKIFDLPKLFLRDGTLQDSIGIETLSGVPAVLLKAGASYPTQATMKFGISADCGCAKFRVYRIPPDGREPTEVSYDAIRGFSADNQTVTVLFEITEDRKIKLSVAVPETLPPGQLLEWMPAREVTPLASAEILTVEKEGEQQAVLEEGAPVSEEDFSQDGIEAGSEKEQASV